MLYLRDLTIKLQERRNRIHRTDYKHFETELQLFLEFLDSNPYTRTLLGTLNVSEAVTFEEWDASQAEDRFVKFPRSEAARAKVCYSILKLCGDDPAERASFTWARRFSAQKSVQDNIGDLNEAVLDPFVNYLHDRIDESSNVLYVLERFKLKAEWFRKDELYERYKDGTPGGEAVLDGILREGLFDGGIDYPFSQPVSPSGKAEVVALLGTEDPLVLEIKVFDPDFGRDKANIRQGFRQVVRYASDFNESVGYLAVFNASDNLLVLTSEASDRGEFPPRVTYGGKTYFLIVIDIRPDRASASKDKPSGRIEIAYDYLTGDSGSETSQ